MREAVFLRKNADKWKQFEQVVDADDTDPDRLADLYVELSDDLAYAQTFYPDSSTTRYLNDLASNAHRSIHRTRPEERNRLRTFWLQEIPRAMAGARTELLVSFAIFAIAILIGTLSAAKDAGFVRLILGDAYVNMTLDNIATGDPMAVYKEAHALNMFLGIAANNVRVALLAFAAGVLLCVGTGYVLFQNGVMLGAFHYLFYEHDLLGPSLLVVYIHGTLEISAILIAGAAGMCLGRGILFPGTYTRRIAFMRGARQGMKIIVSLVPVFVFAALLEGFVTRYTSMPVLLSLAIIGTSLAFIVGYFLVLPVYVSRAASQST